MLTVENDWITYETAATAVSPARRVAVRGGRACSVRLPTMTSRQPGTPRAAEIRPSSAAGSTPVRRRLRLTRRGRVVLVALPTVLALSAAVLALQAAPTAGLRSHPAAPAVVVVGSGDTLWTIARRVVPGTDPVSAVAEIRRLNGLHSDVVQPGQVLTAPGGR